MSDTPDYAPQKKVYKAQGGKFSLFDLLGSFADKEHEVDGISQVSDLHMKVGEAVRFRFDGELETINDGEPLSEAVIQELVFPMLNEEQRDQVLRDRFSDLDAGYHWEDEGINFRINVFHDRDGLAAVIRMLPKIAPPVDTLGFMRDGVWKDLVQLRQGLVLLTGVTGSGKSTTIASIIDYINKSRKCRIITLEDPIEYIFKSEQSLISQRELGKHMRTFPAGLRSVLRENPDIIYVGEMRDPETAALALTAAETGHIVFSTLHTRDVKGTFSRVIDMFPSERAGEIAAQLSFSLNYIISQKLVPRITGVGRVPVFEVLKNNGGIGHMIRSGKFHLIYSKVETSLNEGMNTLEQHLAYLVETGVIAEEDALAYANDSSLLERALE